MPIENTHFNCFPLRLSDMAFMAMRSLRLNSQASPGLRFSILGAATGHSRSKRTFSGENLNNSTPAVEAKDSSPAGGKQKKKLVEKTKKDGEEKMDVDSEKKEDKKEAMEVDEKKDADKSDKKEPEPTFEMLANPARVMKAQLKVINLEDGKK